MGECTGFGSPTKRLLGSVMGFYGTMRPSQRGFLVPMVGFPTPQHARIRHLGSTKRLGSFTNWRGFRLQTVYSRLQTTFTIVCNGCNFVCKFVCSVGGQSYSNTDPSGIHCSLRTINCCMTESVRNQYRSLRWLEIADSWIRTRARVRVITRADQSTNQASRKSRAH